MLRAPCSPYPSSSPIHSCPPHTSSAINVPSISVGLWGGPWPRTQRPKATPHPSPQCSSTHPITWLAFDPWICTSGPISRLPGSPPRLEGGPRRAPQSLSLTCRRRASVGTTVDWACTSRCPSPPWASEPPTPNSPCQGSLCSLNSHFLPFPSEAGAAALGYTSASSPYPARDPRDSFLTRPCCPFPSPSALCPPGPNSPFLKPLAPGKPEEERGQRREQPLSQEPLQPPQPHP